MIVHVVLFKLKDPSPENVATVVGALRGMEGKVPSLLSIEVGVDELRTERSFDVALRTTHESYAKLDEYQNDPLHKEVIALILTLRERSVACDYTV